MGKFLIVVYERKSVRESERGYKRDGSAEGADKGRRQAQSGEWIARKGYFRWRVLACPREPGIGIPHDTSPLKLHKGCRSHAMHPARGSSIYIG
jgi:hypothetical protein